MEKRFLNNDFEQFVKQNADQYRMFPSEKVWNGIHNRLHTRRRWYGLGLALLLISTGVVTWVMLLNPSKKQEAIANASPLAKQTETQKLAIQATTVQAPFNTDKKRGKKVSGYTPFPAESFTRNNDEGERTTETVATVKEEEYIDAPVAVDEPALTRVQKTATSLNKTAQARKVTASIAPLAIIAEPRNINIAKTVFVTEAVAKDKKETGTADDKENRPEASTLTIESVVNSYKKPVLRKKLTWQAYITPTVSYRALNENKAFINAARAVTNSNTPAVTYLPSDLESVVSHKPDMGFQLGATAGYPLSRKIKLITGLQFNISKYDIQAYNYSNEVATVALSNAAGRLNTVSTITNYRIEGGYNRARWLRNFYFSASIPVGLEVKLIEGKRNYFGFAATAQPTYILDNRSYLVSTDYKNYVEIPSLTRKWNVNTGFELFAGVKTGNTEWRVGPQVRYQTLSSYKNKYPIEERLFDFGLKLGIMLK
jgi:hypothetical protein